MTQQKNRRPLERATDHQAHCRQRISNLLRLSEQFAAIGESDLEIQCIHLAENYAGHAEKGERS